MQVLDGFDTEQLTGLIDILLDFVAQTSSEEDMVRRCEPASRALCPTTPPPLPTFRLS